MISSGPYTFVGPESSTSEVRKVAALHYHRLRT